MKGEAAGNSSNSFSSLADNSSRPTLPLYREGEDIASYFIRFERIASLLHLDESDLAVRLGNLLTGKLADVYVTLSDEVTAIYEKLKYALLRCCHRTSDHYCSTFRSAKIGIGETYQQFSTHLGRLFDHWFESTGIERNFTALKSFVILDQFIASFTPELRMFLKENDIRSLHDAVNKAEVWSSAHNSYPKDYITTEHNK